jgi:hypothetical protein
VGAFRSLALARMADLSRRLPNGDRAEFDLRKRTGYCLNQAHARGRHQARVFRDALGIGQADAEDLRAQLLRAAREGMAALHEADEWGERWRVDVLMLRRPARRGRKRLDRAKGSPNPRFVTCWVLR